MCVRRLRIGCADTGCQLRSLVEAMTRCRDRFRRVPALYDPEIPLIGVVGEIFCRLNTFSNEDLIRKLEGYGAECCLSHIGEWVSYTNAEAKRKLLLTGRNISWEMAKTFIRSHIQHADEEALIAPFKEISWAMKSLPSRKFWTLPGPICPPAERWARWC